MKKLLFLALLPFLAACNGELYSKDVHYVSPGIGIVRMESYSFEGNGVWELDYRVDLKSYIIK